MPDIVVNVTVHGQVSDSLPGFIAGRVKEIVANSTGGNAEVVVRAYLVQETLPADPETEPERAAAGWGSR